MSAPNRLRRPYQFLIVAFVFAVVIIPLAMLSQSRSKRQAVVSRQQAAVDVMRQRGATVVLGPFVKSGWPPDVISVDLSRVVVDAELIQKLGDLAGMNRLNLDEAKLQPQDWAVMSKLPRLQSLSLARSNVSDTDVSQLSPALTSLSLNGTSVTDKSMSRLAAMSGLTSLDIANTQVTFDGLRSLEPLRSLNKLWIDDSCITAESVESFRLMQPKNVEIAVSEGLGRRAFELLSDCKGPNITGYHRDGYPLWAADSTWSHTLAGVVEAVVSEIDLDPLQAAQLLEILGKEPVTEGWEPTVQEPLSPISGFGASYNSPEQGIEIASVDEFIRELQKDAREFDYWPVYRFAKEKFNASDVPQLLDAMRTMQYSNDNRLFWYGPFLLVQHGIGNPEVRAELDRLLALKRTLVRLNTICAFGYGGALPFYSREEWVASEAADAFAVPRLLRICTSKNELVGLRDDARTVLVEIAHRRPEYADDAIAVLVGLLDEEGPWHVSNLRHISRVDFPRLAEVDTDAAVAMVPRLRDMLKKLDKQLANVPAASRNDVKSPNGLLHRRMLSVREALSAAAHHDPALAHEIALEFLRGMENGQPVGPFASLLSPNTPEANRIVVIALLSEGNGAKVELTAIAKKIRDWRMTKDGF